MLQDVENIDFFFYSKTGEFPGWMMLLVEAGEWNDERALDWVSRKIDLYKTAMMPGGEFTVGDYANYKFNAISLVSREPIPTKAQELLYKKNKDLAELKIATSSLRRRAFWSEKFPNTQFSDIRGNVQTRLKKLEEGEFDATLFSLAGIKRMEMELEYETLDFMISAPSQGVVAISSRVDDVETKAILQKINHKTTQICVEIERNFLRTLEGGCTAPIGAIAVFEENKIKFSGRLNSLDGSKTINIVEEFEYDDSENYGKKFAEFVLKNGGKEMMEEIKKQIKE
jgi:hydroxymethylbilane synthase